MLTRREPMKRGAPLRRTPFVAKPRRHEYGGSSAEFPTYRRFRAAIFLRDGHECRACRVLHGRNRDATELAHLLQRTGMGGRPASSVNVMWDAIASCYEHARLTDVDKPLCALLVRELVRTYRNDPAYVLPERAAWEVERWAW